MSPFTGFVVACAAPIERAGLDDVAVLELGVGKTAATMTLTARLQQRRPVGVLLFGVAGAFPARHRNSRPPVGPGEVGVVTADVFGDEGVDTPAGFRGLTAMGLGDCGPFRGDESLQQAAARRLDVPLLRGVTVSTCSGTESASRCMFERSGADVETMEGAAVACVCQHLGVPLIQLRAISNWTGDRNHGAWNLAVAVQRAQAAVRRLLSGAG